MSVISMKQLLEAGVHFSHQTRDGRKWRNTSSPKNGIYNIGLQKTVKKIDEAFLYQRPRHGRNILCRNQKQRRTLSKRRTCGQFYVI